MQWVVFLNDKVRGFLVLQLLIKENKVVKVKVDKLVELFSGLRLTLNLKRVHAKISVDHIEHAYSQLNVYLLTL